ncbi:MAG TPA: glutamine--fructose-6-phosphate transaminase (isomerizing) [Candidatus Thermoplasmatota archaeon]|nr:glutamine--fructose-6-phosphate transaminase (isomerizing) [Candidatus Thermoplasmatota archaeon]
MCGIVGVVGLAAAAAEVREGLERLEYRGYDSAGYAWDTGDRVEVTKQVGRVRDLPRNDEKAITLAIGHTRWATHGGVTRENAHPHLDEQRRFAVVHNGTLSAHHQVRARIQEAGHSFRSETDTESLVHLYEGHRTAGRSPLESLQATLNGLEGSWAFLVLDAAADAIAFARHRAPLLIGLVSNGAILLASDATAVLKHTKTVVYLSDGDHGIVKDGNVDLRGADGQPKELKPVTIDWDVKQAERSGFAHFMLKEIHDAPTAINQCLASRILLEPLTIETGVRPILEGVRRVRLLACGTSYHASLMGAYFIEQWAGIPAEAIVASEVRDRLLPVDDGTLYIGVSQSGETHDTLDALRHVRGQGFPILAITNVQGSTLQRMADATMLIRVGPEVGVAATKTLLGQACTLAILALRLAQQTRSLPPIRIAALARELEHLPRTLSQVLRLEPQLKVLGERLAKHRSLFFLGRGIHVATALEAALKFKEITYAHAEGFGAAELKHGPFALLDAETPCVFFLAPGPAYARTLSSIFEVQARGAPCHVLVSGEVTDLEGSIASVTRLPTGDPMLAALTFSLAGQLIAYHAAAVLGRSIDMPRNLAKSVTVE